VSRNRLADEEHSNQVAEISRSLDTKLKELVDQQARQTVSLEIAESEAKLLKDEIRKLQVNEKMCGCELFFLIIANNL